MKIKCFTRNICIIFLFATSCLSTQTLSIYLTKIDSLKNKSILTNEPRLKARLYNAISENYSNLVILDSLKKYSNKALIISEQHNLKDEKAWAFVWLANYCKWTFSRNDYFDYCSKAHDLFKELNLPKGLIKSLNLYGSAHVNFIDKTRGLTFYEEALKMLEHNPDQDLLMETLSNVAQQYNIRKMFSTADSLYRIVRNMTFKYSALSRRVNNNARYAYTLKNLGKIDEALKLMEENLELVKGLPNSLLIYDTFTDYAMFLIEAGQAEKALIYIEKAFQQNCVNINPEYTRLLYFNKVTALLKLGRYKEAYYAKLKEAEYEEEKNRRLDKENLSIRRNAERTETEKAKNEKLVILFSSLALILFIAVLFYINRSRQKTKNNLLLEEKVKSRTEELFSKNIQLTESEEKYKSLFNNNHSIMLLINPETGDIIDANQTACGYYGWSYLEIIKKNIWEINTLTPTEVTKAMKQAKEERHNRFNFIHRLANGDLRDVEVYSGPITVDGKNLLYSIIYDITERKKIDEQLRESFQLNEKLITSSALGIIAYNASGNCILANDSAAKSIGATIEQLLQQNFKELMSWKKSGLFDAAIKALATGEPAKLETLIRTSFGKEIWVDCTFSIFELNNAPHLLFVYQDITERKIIEEKLHLKTEELDNYFTNALDLFCIANTDGYFLKLNKEWENTLGYTLEHLEGIRFLDLVHPDDIDDTLKIMSKLSNHESILNFSNRYKTKSGAYKFIEWRSKPATGNQIFAAARDITERKLSEIAIQESELFVKDVLNSLTAHIAVLNENGIIITINEAWKKFAASNNCPDPNFYLGTNYFSICEASLKTGDSTVRSILQGIKNVKEGILNQYVVEYPCNSPEIERWFTLTVLPQNKPRIGLIVVHQDISERKIAETSLIKLSDRLDLATKAAEIGIWDWDIANNMLLWDDRMFELYGVKREDFSGAYAAWLNGLHPEDRQFADEAINLALRNEKEYSIEFRVLWPDNTIHFIQANANVIWDSEGKPIRMIGTNYDVTLRKEAEEQIIIKNNDLLKLNYEKDKFFSIIAHDLKSPFQGLIGYSEILTSEYSALTEEEKISFISSISELSNSSYKLLENLLDWSRIQTGKMIYSPEKFNLLVELYHTLSLLKETAQNKSIVFDHNIDNSIFITADKNMLLTIIRNLVSNAIKFTNHGGIISLRAKELNKSIEFTVSDTGVGIEKDDLDKLFLIDKNKTSKGTADESGTGLGLILCKEMVEKHGGKIWCKSIHGTGSTFYFTIP